MKLINLQVGTVKFEPHPHAHILTIVDGNGGEVTISGFDFTSYVGECIKREKIADTVAYLEGISAQDYVPNGGYCEHGRPTGDCQDCSFEAEQAMSVSLDVAR